MVSVGDVIAISQLVWDVSHAFVSAPSKIRDASTLAKTIHDEMQIQEQVNKAKLAHKAHPQLQKIIEGRLAEMLANLKQVHKLVKYWAGIHVMDIPERIIFLTLRMPELEDLNRKLMQGLEAVRGLFISLIALSGQVQAKDTNQIQNSIDGLVKKLDEEKKAQIAQNVQIERLLKEKQEIREAALLAKDDQAKLAAAATAPDRKAWDQVESRVLSENQPLTKAEVKKLLDELKSDLESGLTSSPTPSSITTVPAQVGTPMTRVTEWVLAVSEEQGARALMAQIYLEVIRLWTVNTDNRWLYNRVDSAGYRIHSRLSSQALEAGVLKQSPVPSGKLLASSVIAHVREQYGLNKNQDDELESILNRVQEYKTQGIEATHFKQYSHIICFDAKSFDVLTKLRKFAQESSGSNDTFKSQIIRLQMGYLPDQMTASEKKEAYNAMKMQIRGFLTTHFQWKEPTKHLTTGPYRTRQLTIPSSRQYAVAKHTEEIKKMSGCVRLRTHPDTAGGYLVSIVGPKETLVWAERLVNAV